MRTGPSRRASSAFTLIECLIVLTITAILAAISMPIYTDHIRRSHRSDARVTLLQAAHWLERAATATGAYPTASQIPVGILTMDAHNIGGSIASPDSLTVVNERYAVTATTGDGQTFRLSAAPIPGGAQAADPCGSLTLDQAGRRKVQNASLPADQCWIR